MPTNKARTSDNAQKQSASNAIPIFYSDLFFCSLSNKSSSSWSRPCTHHVSSSLPAYIDLILFPYCFRIVSASGSENDRRTIGERYGNDTGSIRDQYGIDTRPVRDRYETGLFRFSIEEIDKKFNFFIIIYFDYILHFSHSAFPAVHAKKPGLPFALAQPLYKDNLPSRRMQAD